MEKTRIPIRLSSHVTIMLVKIVQTQVKLGYTRYAFSEVNAVIP